MVSRPYLTHSVLSCETASHSHQISTCSGQIQCRCPLNTISTLPRRRPITSRIRGCHCCPVLPHSLVPRSIFPAPPSPPSFCGCPVVLPKLSLDTRLSICDCVSLGRQHHLVRSTTSVKYHSDAAVHTRNTTTPARRLQALRALNDSDYLIGLPCGVLPALPCILRTPFGLIQPLMLLTLGLMYFGIATSTAILMTNHSCCQPLLPSKKGS